MTMRIVPIGELRRQLGRIVRAVHEEGDVVTITRGTAARRLSWSNTSNSPVYWPNWRS